MLRINLMVQEMIIIMESKAGKTILKEMKAKLQINL